MTLQQKVQRRMRQQARERRRGIVLLVVVSLLTLFLMIGVTYVLVASNYANSSGQAQRAQRYGDEPEREAEEIIGQLLYGSVNPRSIIGPHNLLADLYHHNDSIIGNVAGVNPVVNQYGGGNSGQCVTIKFNAAATSPTTPSLIRHYYAGRVITFTSGPAAGLSSRVMAYYPTGHPMANPQDGTPEVTIETPESDLPATALPNNGDRFIINGAPFNGTGAGYDVTTGNINASFSLASGTSLAVAYLPNTAFYPPGAPNYQVGGLDEGCDIPNWNDMALAFVPPRKLQGIVPDRTGAPNTPPLPILPSFHRPDLVRFWINALASSPVMAGAADPYAAFINPYGPDGVRGNADDPLPLAQADEVVAIKRMVIMRPLREDHPNFYYSNPNFREDKMALYNTDTDMDGINDRDSDGDGIFDVDNDGDGITDSIWIDAGLPAVTAPNGRKYKRLVAFMIQDLDGRVNVNAHGNLAQTITAPNPNPFRASTPITDTFAGMNPAAPTAIILPRGLGYGPAEVDFRQIFADDNATYRNVLQQRYSSPSWPAAFPGFHDPADVFPFNINDDIWSRIKHIGMPYANMGDHTSPPLSGYALPPDVWGRAAMAVDCTGQPVWLYAGTAERVDDPYEVQFDPQKAIADAPYTVAELEALLRYHDVGASVIPSRLLTPQTAPYLAISSRGTPGIDQIRRMSLGLGASIPAPKLALPREMRGSLPPWYQGTILDLYAMAILNGRGWAPPAFGDPNRAAFDSQIQMEVPFEFLKGQLFNINRELGNGQQDMTGPDNYGPNDNRAVVDDPSEIGPPQEQVPTSAGQRTFHYLNDGTAYDQRQMFARHLYCLAMLLRNGNRFDLPYDEPDTTPSQAETARVYAQWAVNMVDFRDPDSIMTRFEYDENPFDANGWDPSVDGDPASPVMAGIGGVVWGCERPELLISETIGFHDRRSEDLPNDKFNMMDNLQIADPERDGTNDFDQRLLPRGAAFIELYNPWYDRSGNLYDHKARELYGNTNGVQLDRISAVGGSPVWRVIIVHGSPNGQPHYQADPDYPQPEALTLGVNGAPPPIPNYVERTIYFADLGGMGVNRPIGANDGEVYYPSGAIPRAPLTAGRYAVIGSSGVVETVGGNTTYTTHIGRKNGDSGVDPSVFDLANTRRIILDPANQQVSVRDNQAAGGPDVNPANIEPTVALPVDTVLRSGVPTSQSFNISEPVGGYNLAPPGSAWTAPSPTDEGHFDPPVDQPFDIVRTDGGQVLGSSNGTVVNYRTVHLQRLANPLLAWDAVSNPYITIDTSSFDVTAFNGVTSAADPSVADGNQNFQTFQRGGRFYATDAEAVNGYIPLPNRLLRDLWPKEPFGAAAQAPSADSPAEGATGPHYFTLALYHSLGYLNKRYHPYFTGGAYRGVPAHQDGMGNTMPPFPYFAFNNRPFMSPMELLQVPRWHSSKVLEQFNFQNVVAPPLPAQWQNMYDEANQNLPYSHVFNFFQTDNTPNTVADQSPEFCRLLDYVETRSPYVGTEKYFNPDAFTLPGNPSPPTPPGFRPPYNYLSRFRDPGRININTIFDELTWNAATRGFPGMCSLASPEGDGGRFLTHLAMSRQGYGTAPSDLLQHNALYPSLFSQPFRTADAADLMPPNPNTVPPPFEPRKSPANGGLLRRDPNNYPPNPPYPDDNDRPLFASRSVVPYQDASRNPYFRFQALQKVGNLFTTNSNVFAVWITVGYFEVEQNPPSAIEPNGVGPGHPDGLRLAGEVGADSGEIKRHRFFYIIDRSVPVGYEPGHRHNTDKAVLLKRFIE